METDTGGDTEATENESREGIIGRGLSLPYLDDAIASLIIVFYLALVVGVTIGALDWSLLPESLQYWTTTAFVVALTLIFGKGVTRFRRRE